LQPPQVIVVGAGIIGSSIAWRIAQSGIRVRLMEAGVMGGQASPAGAGMLAPGGELSRQSYFAELLIHSMDLYPGFVAELSQASGIAIDYRVCGAIETPENPDDWSALLARTERQSQLGIAWERQGDSLYYPNDAIVDPGHVMAALRIACERAGVDIQEHSPVHRIDDFAAQDVVLAAGAWSTEIEIPGFFLPEAFPMKGHLIGYDLPPGTLGPIRRRGDTYVLQRSNGFVVAGSTMEDKGFDTTVDPAIVDDLADRAAALVPELRGLRPVRAWTGLRPQIAAEHPVIGRYGDSRLWLAYGHFRNGILAAPATAEYVAATIISSLEKP
jgi:glycine oxidase